MASDWTWSDENVSLIDRYTQMLTTAPDGETLEARAQWVLDHVQYDTLPSEEKAIFEMTLRIQREEFGIEPETPVHSEVTIEPTKGAVTITAHKTGKLQHIETGAEFQAVMLETMSKGDSTSLHHWWEANMKAVVFAAQLWPVHADRVVLIAQDKGLHPK